jgi:IMP dehydrogenase
MGLFFQGKDLLNRNKGLTFNDVLLVPKHSTITSRSVPDLSCFITKKRKLKIPIIAANMDTVSEVEMCLSMGSLGGMAILHRFMPLENQVEQVKIMIRKKTEIPDLIIAASVGVKEEGMNRADHLINAGCEVITVDIAHGDSVLMYETLDYIKKKYPHVEVIAGNTATFEGVKGMIDHGADSIKIGIGPGSMCTTRLITGCGIPQLTAIALAYECASKYNIPIIADGGIKNSGDICKALACGASTIMVGSLLAGTLETPGEIKHGMKKYRGMASKDAQTSWRGELPKGMAPEGESTLVACKGRASDVVNELCGGIRSSMSYLNAQNLVEFFDNASFIEMTNASYQESTPHGVGKVF